MSGATWLVSYPRSGNTWVRLALWSALNPGKPPRLDVLDGFARSVINRATVERVMEADSSELTAHETEILRADYHEAEFRGASPSPFVKVHDLWRVLGCGRMLYPASITHAAIYLVRDPRDIAVSWAAFKGQSLDWAIDFLCDPEAMVGRVHPVRPAFSETLGSWSGHVRSWLDDAPFRVIPIRYEDLLADTPAMLSRIIHAAGLAAGDDAVRAAASTTRFDRVSALEQAHGFSHRPATADRFFRVGKSGTWREILTPAQAATIERAHGETMARLGYLGDTDQLPIGEHPQKL
jgi:aryl sulfotransferase